MTARQRMRSLSLPEDALVVLSDERGQLPLDPAVRRDPPVGGVAVDRDVEGAVTVMGGRR